MLTNQIVKFLAAGGVAAIANFGSRFFFSFFVDFEYAVVLAFLVGLSAGYILSRTFVFARSRHTIYLEMTYYVAVNLLALAQTWLVSVYLARSLTLPLGLDWAQAIAHIIGIMLPVITSYVGHKYFTFKERPTDGGQ